MKNSDMRNSVKKSRTSIIKLPNFTPAYFTTVMGSGAFAIATLEMANAYPPLHWLAWFLNIINFIVFFILACWFILTLKQTSRDLLKNFDVPSKCALYSTCGISLLVLAAQALRFGLGETLAIWLWAAGAIITLFLNFAILLRFFLHPGLEIDHMTPIFFIPVAGLVVVPVAGSQICSMLNPIAADIAIMVCVLSLGGGLVLYLGLLCIMLHRHLLASPLPDQLSPTFWIHLAPIGWGGVSLARFTQYVAGYDFTHAAQLGSLLLFGGALWWLIMAALICCVAIAKHKLKFNLVWWSFVFPTGSLAILSNSLTFPTARSMFSCLYLLLAGLWAACALNTLFQGISKISQLIREK